MYEKPSPIDNEIVFDSDETLMIKIDNKGVIEYANDSFINLSGYKIHELIGQDVSILRHPDMPSTITDHVWMSIFKKTKTRTIIKYIAKKGAYFWLQINIDFKVNELTRDIDCIYLYYTKVNPLKIQELRKTYTTLSNIEKHSGTLTSENYFIGVLEDKSLTYSSYMDQYFQN